MGMRSIQFLACATLTVVAGFVAIQTGPSSAADVCRLTVVPDHGSVELAALFTNDAEDAGANSWDDAAQFIYVADDIASDSNTAILIDVSDVTRCAHGKNIKIGRAHV